MDDQLDAGPIVAEPSAQSSASAGSRARDTLLDAALDLADQCIPVFPLGQNKRPACENGFKDASLDPQAIARMFANPIAALIGVPTGEASGYDVLDVDPRNGGEDWVRENAHRLPRTRIHFTRSGGFHYLFTHTRGMRNSASKIAPGIDIRGDGGYVVWWPACDCDVFDDSPIAEMPEWLRAEIAAKSKPKAPPQTAPANPIPRELADTDMLARKLQEIEQRLNDAPEGEKHATLCRESFLLGGLIYATDWTDDDAAEWLTARLPSTVEDWDAAHKTALSGIAKGKAQQVPLGAAAGFARVPLPPEPEPGSTTRAELATPAKVVDVWERLPVPPFPIEYLPATLRAVVEDDAATLGADLTAVAMAHLAATAACVDSRTALRVKRHGDWRENPRLWVMLTGDPSSKKTPLLNAVVKPLNQMQRAAAVRYKLAKDLWEKQPKSERGSEPKLTRYVINDATPEKTAEILSANPRGVLAHMDEMSMWIGRMESYTTKAGSSANRAFWLSAYQGGFYVQDRVTRGTITVENLSVSIIGGMQPDRLRDIGEGLSDDGLIQRFIPILMGPAGDDLDRAPSPALEQHAAHMAALLEAPARSLYLDAVGHVFKDEAFAETRRWERAGGEYGKGFTSWAGKGTAHIMRLALALHFADPASLTAPDGLLPARTVQAAAEIWRRCLVHHARGFYANMAGDAGENTRQIAAWLLVQPNDVIGRRDFSRGPTCCRHLTPKQLQERLGALVTAEWLIPESSYDDCGKWTLAPGVREQFAAKAKQVAADRKWLREQIRDAADIKASDDE